MYRSPDPEFGNPVRMTVDVTENNLTLIWTVTRDGKTTVIDENSDRYGLKDHNKVICCSCILCS